MGQSSSAEPLQHPRPPRRQTDTIARKLADVELQLVMHGLEGKEVLQLARCSRRLLAAADSQFAWKHSLLRVNCAAPQVASVCSAPLLRHAPLGLDVRRAMLAKDLDALLLLPLWHRVVELRSFDRCDTLRYQFRQLLSHASAIRAPLRAVRFLRSRDVIRHSMEDGLVRGEVAALPNLDTLQLLGAPAAVSQPFRNLPSLTSLSFIDGNESYGYEQSLLADVAACTKLTHLAVKNPILYGDKFREFFTAESSYMRQLQSLTLDCFWAVELGQYRRWKRVPPEDYTASFLTLSALHTLNLVCVSSIDLLLPHLAFASALRTLSIRPVAKASSVPSALVLSELLSAAPHLHCCTVWSEPPGSLEPLDLQRRLEAVRRRVVPLEELKRLALAHKDLAKSLARGELKPFAHRLHLRQLRPETLVDECEEIEHRAWVWDMF